MPEKKFLSGWTVLVIDDEPDGVMVAQMLLERYGATVFTASNGQEGFEVAQKHRPRFILSDLSMPVMDGWKLNELIQNTPELRDTPVIALTAHAMQGDREKAISAGFHNYLTKPLIPKTFIRDLLRLLVDIPTLTNDIAPYLEE